MSDELIRLGEQDGTRETRTAFVEACSSLQSYIEHDFILDVAKKVTDARKKIMKGVGEGVGKLAGAYGQ